MKLRVPTHAAAIGLFLLLAFLCYQAHQLTRHLVGAGLCGGFGTMTFTVATPREPCGAPTLLALSGPLLTYGLAYSGMLLLRAPRSRLFGYALIFGSFAHLRFIQTLTGRGDELGLAELWLGLTSRPVVAAIVLLIGIPPLYAAYRVIGNPRRRLVFWCSWLLPLPLLFVMLTGDALLFQTSAIGTQLGALLGIWLLVLLVDVGALASALVLGPRYLRRANASAG